jgi:hypothetical protein
LPEIVGYNNSGRKNASFAGSSLPGKEQKEQWTKLINDLPALPLRMARQ